MNAVFGTNSTDEHVVVGMSGGVDSSVAAWLLHERGFRLTGLFMKNWEEDDTGEYCAAAADLADAEAVCERLGIELKTINFSAEYWERVFERFLADFRAGHTPNPDILCNREIKFKEFLIYAESLGAQCIATGHYAGRSGGPQGWRLMRAADRRKDQSYFLYTLDQRALSRTMFPLAGLLKRDVRDTARRAGLPVFDKKDSTGICFIGERRFKEFLSRYLRPDPGAICDLDGRVRGRHDGLMYYTLGQRQGLGIGGPGSAWYVAGKDLERNTLYVVQSHDHPALYSDWLLATELSWVAARAPDLPLRCSAKTRYRQPDQACVLHPAGDRILVRFAEPQRAVTPGQAVVFYAGDECLGGGTIATCAALSGSVPRPSDAA